MSHGERRSYVEAKRNLIRVATGVTAYVAAIKYGPRFGVDLPTAGCLIMAFANQLNEYTVATHLLFSGMNNALNAGRAKNIQGCMKNLALSAMGYSMTTRALSSPVDKFIKYTVGTESFLDKTVPLLARVLAEAAPFAGLGAYFGAVRQGSRFGVDLPTAASSMVALWQGPSVTGIALHLFGSGLWNAVNAVRARNIHGFKTHSAIAAMGVAIACSNTLSKPFEKFVERLAPGRKNFG